VFHHGDVIAELSGEANGRFDTGVRDQPDDDELMNAVLLQLQIKVSVCKPAGAPVFLGYNFTWPRQEFGAEFATPCAEFEGPVLPCPFLNGRNVFPRSRVQLIVCLAASTVGRNFSTLSEITFVICITC